jgi:tRNA 2-thiouridine synthesizing protein A
MRDASTGALCFTLKSSGLLITKTKDEAMDFDKEVDARGLNCPLPILRAKKALAELEHGQVVRIIATDPGSVKDFQAFAKQTGNELVKQGETADKAFEFFMRRK